MRVIKGAYDVFLPESVLWIVQQELFGHKGAVESDCATATKK